LVGISPAKHDSSDNWGNNVTVYVSSAYTGPATGGATKPAYSKKTASAAGYGTYANIPYETDGTTNDRSVNNLYISDQSTKTSKWGAGIGDICQYLGEIGAAPSGYRMPISNQFGSSSDWTNSTTYPSSDMNSSVNAEGTTTITGKGWLKNNAQGIYFLAAGCRSTDGALYNVGTGGRFWSSSASNASNGYLLSFYSGFIDTAYNIDRQVAYSVRCVKD
jgi:uncharacterized protein (TIGR02145 family)